MYSPDRVFMQRLKGLDPRLGCRYEPGHHHFVITYKRAIGEDVPVMLIEGVNGMFRQPDDRDILKLQESDLHRVPLHDRLRQVAAYMEKDREDRALRRKAEIKDRTKDDHIQLSRTIGKIDRNNGGKSMPYRRIDLRPKGQVFTATAPENQA
jgi:hypothetical protein